MRIAPTRPAPAQYLTDGTWSGATLSSAVDAAAAGDPGGLAVVDGDTRLSWAELRAAVHLFAASLRAAGVGRGDVVTVMLPNWHEAVIAMQAVLRLGAVVCPVVPIYRDREVSFILGQSAPVAVVVPHRFRGFDYAEMMQRLMPGLVCTPEVIVVRPEKDLPAEFSGWDAFHEQATRSIVADAAVAADICLLLYTSGTTADPKGVLHSHQTLDYECRSIIELFSLGSSDAVFMPSPLTHITGFLFGVLSPPMLGAPAVLLDVWDAARAHALIEAERCRFTMAATPFLSGLLEQYESSGLPSALRVFTCGGADVPPPLVRRARRVMGAGVVRVYGSSEFPTLSCGSLSDSEHIAADTDGRPIGPVQVRVDALDGVPGELQICGPELFLGYLDPALNADAFTPDGWFRTGDLATFTEGAVTIRGRQKDIIVRGGENISAKEVEDLLFEHPQVREVAVVAMADPVLVERVCAFVVPAPGTSPTLDSLCELLTGRRIARQKHPERLELVEELPKTASGKVQKYVLRSLLADQGEVPVAAKHQ
jgi:cyclohexanecarboxylate-CoA ligase